MMKKIDKKNIIIGLLSLVVLGFTVYVLFEDTINVLIYEFQYRREQAYRSPDDEVATELATAVESYGHPQADRVADVAYSCDGLYFYGDTGYLIKGQLLDQSVTSAYKNLPDTIAIIHYGEQIDQLDEIGIDFYNKKARFSPHKKSDNNTALTSYLNMAEKGQVEFLRFLPNKQGNLELEDQCDFSIKYGEYFNPDVSWQRDIPLAIKEVLVDYFRSEEGSIYDLVGDRRALSDVVCPGTFTGKDRYTDQPNRELALVLTEKDPSGSPRERILVIGYDDRHHHAYILYNEVFYRTKLLIKRHNDPYKLPEEAAALAKYVSPYHQIIEVKTDGNERFYLYYEKEFDTMNRKQFGNDDEAGECGGC